MQQGVIGLLVLDQGTSGTSFVMAEFRRWNERWLGEWQQWSEVGLSYFRWHCRPLDMIDHASYLVQGSEIVGMCCAMVHDIRGGCCVFTWSYGQIWVVKIDA